MALEGLKVLEWGSMVAAPYCGKLLADLGAEVIKVEEPQVGDEARRHEPFPQDRPDPECSGLFLYLNDNKLSITLNPKTSTGKGILLKLVQSCDVLIEDKPPGLLRRLGLTYNALKKVNPRLVMTSITPFGQKGPYANFKAYHINTFHAGGEGFLLPGGVTDRPPVKPGSYVGDYDSGLHAAIATLGALYWSQSEGTGQHIDVSRQMCTMTLTRAVVGKYTYDKMLDNRAMRRSRIGTNLRCQDGYVVVQAAQDAMWQALMDLIGHPAWSHEEKYADPLQRQQHIDEINTFLEEWTSRHTKAEVERMGQEKHIPIGAVSTPEDVFKSPQLEHRGFFVELDHPRAGRLRYPTWPYRFEKTPASLERAAPLLGEHNQLVYCQRLGYPAEELPILAQAGII